MTEAELSRLFSEYGYVLFRRCLLYLGDEAGAQDAVQDVFVRALRSTETFRAEADPWPWLCRIADHLCVDLLRRKRRNQSAGQSDAQQLAAAILDDDRDAFLTLQGLLTGLDPGARRLAVLYYLDEFTQEAIAAELGFSRRKLGKRLKALEQRARALLGRQMTA
jgi:RNA polymerase sigma-70 factor (ECF subfamily)